VNDVVRLYTRHTKWGHLARVDCTWPNEIWSLDITKLHRPKSGPINYLYVILDIYRHYVMGWMLAVLTFQTTYSLDLTNMRTS